MRVSTAEEQYSTQYVHTAKQQETKKTGVSSWSQKVLQFSRKVTVKHSFIQRVIWASHAERQHSTTVDLVKTNKQTKQLKLAMKGSAVQKMGDGQTDIQEF